MERVGGLWCHGVDDAVADIGVEQAAVGFEGGGEEGV